MKKIYPTPRSAPRVSSAAALVLALLSANSASAAAKTWEGNTNGSLTVGSNWVGGIAPISSTDALVFGVAGTAGTSLTLGTGFSATNAAGGTQAIHFTAGASAYTFNGSGQLTAATGGLRNESGQLQTFNNPFRFSTGNTHNIFNPNSALVFNGAATLNNTTNTFALGGSTGQSITFNGNVDGTLRALTLNGGAQASTVSINGSANTGIATLNIGSNIRVNLGSTTALGSATTVTLNGGNATVANTAGSPFSTNASLAFNATSQAYAFGASGHTSANNLTFAGSGAISADQSRTLTLNGTGLTVTSASTWNNTVTGSRTLNVNGAGNTFALAGLAIGASGETSNVTLTIGGSANLTLSSGVTNGLGTGTRSLQVFNAGTFTINGSSNYTGTTGIGSDANLIVNGTHAGGGNYTVQGSFGGGGTVNLSANNAALGFTASGVNRRLIADSTDTLTFVGGASDVLNLTNAAGREDGNQSFFFTLGAPGSTVVNVQGGLNIGSGTLNFDDFAFATGTGFGAGVYNLFGYTSIAGSMGAALSGTVGGFDATISNDILNSAVILTVSAIPEPSSFAVFAGLGAVSVAGLRRRRRVV